MEVVGEAGRRRSQSEWNDLRQQRRERRREGGDSTEKGREVWWFFFLLNFSTFLCLLCVKEMPNFHIMLSSNYVCVLPHNEHKRSRLTWKSDKNN